MYVTLKLCLNINLNLKMEESKFQNLLSGLCTPEKLTAPTLATLLQLALEDHTQQECIDHLDKFTEQKETELHVIII